ncbi:hypothetical protein GCM10028801_03540 [Nocardioides maradonensis]
MRRTSRDPLTTFVYLGPPLLLLAIVLGFAAHQSGSVMTARTTAVVTRLDGSHMEMRYRDAQGHAHIGTDECSNGHHAHDCAEDYSLGQRRPIRYDPHDPSRWQYAYVSSRTWWCAAAVLGALGGAMLLVGLTGGARRRRPRSDAWLARHPRGAAVLPLLPLPPAVTADALAAVMTAYSAGSTEQAARLDVPGMRDWRFAVRPPEGHTDWGTRRNPWVVRGVYDDSSSNYSGVFNGFYWLTEDRRGLAGYARGDRESVPLTYGLAAFATLGPVALAIAAHDARLLGFLAFAALFGWVAWITPRAVHLQEQACAQGTVRALLTTAGAHDASQLRIWDEADAYERSHGFSLLRRSKRRPPKPPVDRSHSWRRRPWPWVVVRTGLGLPFVYAAAHWFVDPHHHLLALPVSLAVVVMTLGLPVARAVARTRDVGR